MEKQAALSNDSTVKSDMGNPMDCVASPASIHCSAPVEEKALLRKIDLRVIPVLFVLYLAAFLDRVNISNALTLNLPRDLHLKGDQENIALTIFFVPYIIFETPSNIFMRRFNPHIWLSGCMLAFGIIMLCQGFVRSYSGLLATRFCLGLAEAGVFPGSFYLISFWYKREESQKRFTIYWCSVLTATMFGGLLASAISKMNNVRGLANWRWLFVLEGIFTIIVGITSYFLIPDFPEEAVWLTEDERKFVVARAATDHKKAEITPRGILLFLTDLKNVLGGVMYFATVVPIYAFAYFAPTIVKTLGYSTVQTQLHTIPPTAAALALCLIVAFLSDHLRLRFPFVAFGFALTITGLAVLMTVQHDFHVQYAGLCLVAMGAFSAGPIIVCWYVMNLQGHSERNIGTAWIISFGNSGGIVAVFSFLSKDAPEYHTGYSICMAFTCIGALAAIVYATLIMKGNMRTKAEGGNRENFYAL